MHVSNSDTTMKIRPLALAAVLAAVAVQAAQQTYAIQYKPVKGSKTVYSITFDIDSPSLKVTYAAKLTNEVVEVKGDGAFIMASYQSDGVTTVDGVKQPSAAETITAVTTYDKFGKPTAIGGDNATPESFRVANLTSFVAPAKAVSVGETWTVKISADEKEKTRAVTHIYRVLSIDKGVAVVDMSAVESAADFPASAKGRVWVSLANGEQTKFDLLVKNMPIGGVYIDGKVLITKQ
jgi:hypothetical protein